MRLRPPARFTALLKQTFCTVYANLLTATVIYSRRGCTLMFVKFSN